MLISAVISILDDFGSLLPARTVTVNLLVMVLIKVFDSSFQWNWCSIESEIIINFLQMSFENLFAHIYGINEGDHLG